MARWYEKVSGDTNKTCPRRVAGSFITSLLRCTVSRSLDDYFRRNADDEQIGRDIV